MKNIIPDNITESQKAYLIGKRYENEKKLRKNEGGLNQYSKEVCAENQQKPTTSQILGKEYGINQSTVRDNEKFAKGLDVLPEPIKQGILADHYPYVVFCDAPPAEFSATFIFDNFCQLSLAEIRP